MTARRRPTRISSTRARRWSPIPWGRCSRTAATSLATSAAARCRPASPRARRTSACACRTRCGKLIPVGDVITAFKALKTDPSRVLVSAITGPAAPSQGQRRSVAGPGRPGNVAVRRALVHEHRARQLGDVRRSRGAHQAVGRWVRHARPLPEPLRPQLHERPHHVDRRAGRLRLRAAVLASDDRPEQVLDSSTTRLARQARPRSCVRARAARTPEPCWYTKVDATACPSGREVVFNRLAASACRSVDDGDLQLSLYDPAAAGRRVRLVDVRDVVVLDDAGLGVFVLVVVLAHLQRARAPRGDGGVERQPDAEAVGDSVDQLRLVILEARPWAPSRRLRAATASTDRRRSARARTRPRPPRRRRRSLHPPTTLPSTLRSSRIQSVASCPLLPSKTAQRYTHHADRAPPKMIASCKFLAQTRGAWPLGNACSFHAIIETVAP